MLLLVKSIAFTIAFIGTVQAVYPFDTLRCFASQTKPDMKLICPEARAKYCVKEVTNLKQDLCGKTQYFGDVYSNSICEFKKCSAECEEGNYRFEYAGKSYTRTRYCCNDGDYCNSGNRNFHSTTIQLVATCILFLVGYWLI